MFIALAEKFPYQLISLGFDALGALAFVGTGVEVALDVLGNVLLALPQLSDFFPAQFV